ncbi:RNA-directed DNA polymerase, eukaryota, reverse transcriptase zinc-binding domain protein [Tanacetum coccineum]|uniref:RNA-directed DNA polymerase, eukaryota, reverse transcriptase zinc-binding domain protein n=1 Tax=Tanacetum coccineum TaxID=301880 RepID=A0ABQ5ABY6_9ASTR
MRGNKNKKRVQVSKRIERIGSKNREERIFNLVWKTDKVNSEKRNERYCESKIERELCDKNRQSEQEEGLQLCAVLETHVKYKNIKKTSDNVFGNWECISNGEDNNKGCRLMIGWNASLIQAGMISQSRQYIFLLIETIDKRSKFFCTVIYASNLGMERRKLWKDLEIQKVITNGIPWVILGDFNVTLKVSKHTNGSANLSSEMSEFQDGVNYIEVDDLHSEGFYYTWTKVRIPNGVQKRKGSFKFSNFITDKEEFLPTAENLRKEVKEVHKEVDMFPHEENIKEKSCQILNKYYEAIQDKYSFLCHKAKVEWLKEGDRNTAFFHKTVKERVHRGRILTIRNEEGVIFENDDVAVQIVKHFEDFLGKSRPMQKLSSRNAIFLNKLNNEEALKMVRPVRNSEIKNAMFDIEDSNALGPDGHTLRFYKSAWSIIGKEVCTAVREFFLRGKLLGEIMTNRIKGVLGSLVNENQSAFIGGRHITDNILLSQELFRGYNRKLNIKKISFKIDLQKAYDTISWEFIKDYLVMFGFHEKMIRWIMTYVTTTKFSISVNGERVGYFKRDRGLRQGDPISLYLFTLVMEVLNLLIRKNIEENGEFKYHYGYKNLRITHLCFADDLLVFCHRDCNSVKVIKKSLDEFSGLSGLVPNMKKIPIRYLGVPLIPKQISISACKPLVNKVKAKIRDGKSVNVWYDKWCPASPLSEFINTRDIYDARLKMDFSMSEIINKGRWVWPEEWNNDFEELKRIQIPVIKDEVKDKAIWISNNGIEKCFKVSNAWKDLNYNAIKVD